MSITDDLYEHARKPVFTDEPPPPLPAPAPLADERVWLECFTACINVSTSGGFPNLLYAGTLADQGLNEFRNRFR